MSGTSSEDQVAGREAAAALVTEILALLAAAAHRLPNHKEIYFRLTRRGRELFTVHQAFDNRMERGIVRFLERYQPDELLFLVRMLREASETSFLSLGSADGEATGEATRVGVLCYDLYEYSLLRTPGEGILQHVLKCLCRCVIAE